jgi:Domain of unknown function (DUF4340)
MKTNTLYSLIAAALIALFAAAWIHNANSPVVNDGAEQGKPLLPGLTDQINEVDSIVFAGAGNKVSATLKRGADGWHVVEKSGYPADLVKLREFLLKLSDATVLEPKTANPKRYADLGVEDISSTTAKGVLVTLGGLKTPLKLVIGLFNGQGGSGTFVRRDGEAQSLLASGNLLAEKDAASWIKHELIDIDPNRIKDIVLTSPDGKILHVAKDQPDDRNFKVADLPKGREVASDYVANSLGSGLANLRADDVIAAKDSPPPDKVYKVRYVGFGGFAIDAMAWEASGKTVLQLIASNDQAQLDGDIALDQAKSKAGYETAVAAAKLKAVELKGDAAAIAKAAADVPKPPAVEDPDKDRAAHEAIAAKVVEDMNRTFKGWIFVVPAYAFANYNKTMDDMLKSPQTKPAPGAKPAGLQLPGQTGSTPVIRSAPAVAH